MLRPALLELCNVALELPCMQANRDAVVQILERKIGSRIPRSRDARTDVLAIVQTCYGYEGGMIELREAVAFLDTGTIAFREFDAILRAQLVTACSTPRSPNSPDSQALPASDRVLKVFLCHGSEDKAAVRALRQRLMASGFEP